MGMKLMDIIKEQSKLQRNVQYAYNRIVDAVAGVGTDKELVLMALKDIQTIDEFNSLLSLFKDGKTGYRSFEDMVNGEYDQLDYNDVVKISNQLNKFGLKPVFKYQKALGKMIFTGGFKLKSKYSTPPNINSKNQGCKDKWEPLLAQAVKYWKDWLTHPTTKSKFEKNWGAKYGVVDGVKVDLIFQRYIQSLEGLKIIYYDKTYTDLPQNAYAFVKGESPKNIYVNCSQNDPAPLNSMVHEIQHLLYSIKPLNPNHKIGDIFVTKETKRKGPADFFEMPSTTAVDMSSKAVIGGTVKNTKINWTNISSKTGVKEERLKSLHATAVKLDKEKNGYVCRSTEKMSNIMAIRMKFNMGPTDELTYDMIKPYVDGTKIDTDLYWFILCWALNGFNDINQTLNKMNQMAFKNTRNNNDQQLS